MGFFRAKRKSEDISEYFLAVDTGTEFVKCIVFKRNENNAEILGKGTAVHVAGSMRGGMVINIPEVSKTIKLAIDLATADLEVHPQNLIMSLPGDLVRSLVTTVHYHRSRPEAHLDATEIKNIAYKVQWKAYEQARIVSTEENETSNQVDIKLISTGLIDTQIDGYKVENPLGFQGNTVTISIFNAFAPLVHLGALQAIADELDLDLISVVAGPYAVAKLLSENEEEAIMIDVGSENTDVVVVSGGSVMGMQNFAFGSRAFDQTITDLKYPSEKAARIKHDYTSGKLSKKITKQLSEKFKQVSLTWVKGITATLEEFGHLDILPNRIFVTGGGSLIPEIKNALMTKEWTTNLPFSKKPYAALMKLDNLKKIGCSEKISIDSADAVLLGLINLTLETDTDENMVSAIIRRLVVSMQS
ncbi:hypothetical protein KKE14_01315 [Patescibacteria group bacterium]|nr:hypothetical protein [Patescibacteria group bacterium]